MITALHSIIYSSEPETARAFFKDVLGLDSVDSGGGWLIFALPPAELAVHPDEEGGRHELYLMCDDLEATMAELTAKGAVFTKPVTQERWGRLTYLEVPGGGELGLYQPHHPTAYRS
jgi:predicted enzyme related to lactoylglutathione lyase